MGALDTMLMGVLIMVLIFGLKELIVLMMHKEEIYMQDLCIHKDGIQKKQSFRMIRKS